jgi:hypothetical protein
MTKYVLPGDSFETTHHRIGQEPFTLVSEHVAFVPAKNIEGQPPYIKGVLDSCWVKYRKGERPSTKEGWQNIIHMELLPLDKQPE